MDKNANFQPGDDAVWLRSLFDQALEAADPRQWLPSRLPDVLPEWFSPDRPAPSGRLIVIGVGKAAASMAQAVESALPPGRDIAGLVVTRYGYALPCRQIEIVEAAHPVPDAAGQQATERLLALVDGLSAADTVLALISGGASALLAAPRPGLSLQDKRSITRGLLVSGASIHEINCVRKHLSMVKGGQLAQRIHPARLVTLALSDVTGDEPAVIGSGPTVADPTTCADALEVIDRYRVAVPDLVRRSLLDASWETPKPGAADFPASPYILIGSAQAVLQQISERATLDGVAPLVLGDAIEGEAREVARAMAGIALSCQRHGVPLKPPCVILSGGETSVTVKGGGRGGRNTEFLLALAVALRGRRGISALAADTDGIDGSESNAGALYVPTMLSGRPVALQEALVCLANNDAYTWFAARDALVTTGPTFTNVNDFRALLVLPDE